MLRLLLLQGNQISSFYDVFCGNNVPCSEISTIETQLMEMNVISN